VNQLSDRLLDFIYPTTCHYCQRALTHGRQLCTPCRDSLHFVEPPFCSRCGECYDGSIKSKFICPNCHDLKLNFDFARAALHSDGEGRALVHDLKYRHQIHLSVEIARLLEYALEDTRFAPYKKSGILIPVPLHWLRLRKRRFNQSEEIARSLEKLTTFTTLNALKRIRNTQTQTRFTRKQRLENLKGAFRLKPRFQSIIRDHPVILVDDVFTTGSTANECAKVLTENGATRVAVLTLLRG